MTDVSKTDDFVTQYAELLPDSDSSELQKILEMRSMRRSEQTQLIQTYRQRFENVSGSTKQSTQNSALTPSGLTASGVPSTLSAVVSSLAADAGITDSSMRRLEKLVKKKF